MDKLLAKDVAKGKIQQLDANEARDRVSIAQDQNGLRDVDMVVEVCCSAFLTLYIYI